MGRSRTLCCAGKKRFLFLLTYGLKQGGQVSGGGGKCPAFETDRLAGWLDCIDWRTLLCTTRIQQDCRLHAESMLPTRTLLSI